MMMDYHEVSHPTDKTALVGYPAIFTVLFRGVLGNVKGINKGQGG
jgi:hypothetical protein